MEFAFYELYHSGEELGGGVSGGSGGNGEPAKLREPLLIEVSRDGARPDGDGEDVEGIPVIGGEARVVSVADDVEGWILGRMLCHSAFNLLASLGGISIILKSLTNWG